MLRSPAPKSAGEKDARKWKSFFFFFFFKVDQESTVRNKKRHNTEISGASSILFSQQRGIGHHHHHYPLPLVLGVACRSPCLSLAGFSDAAKQDATCTPLTVTPPPSFSFPSSSQRERKREREKERARASSPSHRRPSDSFPAPLSPSRLSLSSINKIAHLPRKLIARLNFSVRMPVDFFFFS